MTVFVDDMYLYPMGEFKRGRFTYKMSHLIADTEAELHAMADTIGLARRYYQGDHYDVNMTMRRKCIAAGAIEITLEQCSAMSVLRDRNPNVKLVEPAKATMLRAEQHIEKKATYSARSYPL